MSQARIGTFETMLAAMRSRLAAVERRLVAASAARPSGQWTMSTRVAVAARATILLPWPIVLRTPVGVSKDADGVFTVQRTGWWLIVANVRFGGTTNNKYVMILPSDGSTNLAKASSEGDTKNLSVSLLRHFRAGEVFGIAVYTNQADSVQRENDYDEVPTVSVMFQGP